jgi:hypothetical protein
MLLGTSLRNFANTIENDVAIARESIIAKYKQNTALGGILDLFDNLLQPDEKFTEAADLLLHAIFSTRHRAPH